MIDAEFLAVFRLVAGEFAAKPDGDVLAMFNMVKSEISEKRFGSLYPQAAAYRTAHQFAWLALVAAGGSTDASATGGTIVSEKEGDLQRSYSDAAGTGCAGGFWPDPSV